MKILNKSLLLMLILYTSLNAVITIDIDEVANLNCPGDMITEINNLSTSLNENATGTMQIDWDVDRMHFKVNKAGLVKISLTAPKILTIKAGNQCDTETFFRSEDKMAHSQEFRVKAGESINLTLFDWDTGAGYDYDLNIVFTPDDIITPPPSADTTPPVITLNGENPVNLIVGNTYTDTGATATDNVDGDITALIQTASTVDTSTAGNYTVTYTVSDQAGNNSSKVRNIIVSDDYTPPPPSDSDFIESQNETNGDCPGEIITALNGANSHISLNGQGVMNYSWDVDRFSFTPNLKGEVKITLITPKAMTIKAGNMCNTETYFRSPEGILSYEQTIEVEANELVALAMFDWETGAGYEYSLDIEFTPNGVTPPPATDTTKPVITLNGANPINLTIGDIYTELGASAEDNIDGDITALIQTASTVDTSTAGNYTVTYTVSDQAGNSSSKVRNVIVSDDYTPPPASGSGITINEVLAANASINLDPDFKQFSDWIELYNNEDHAIDIGGYYLSNDLENSKKWKIPSNTKIYAHQYLLIWSDEKNNNSTDLHTNFKLSQKGESLTLANTSGTIIDYIEFPKQKGNISCAKKDGSIVYMTPTPNAINSQVHEELKLSKKPKFSIDSGFYNDTQTIELTQENSGLIYYTIDGSIPTKNSTLYSQPIIVDKTTIIRTKGLEDGKFLSATKNRTYLINEDITLPVVSIGIDDEYLWDDDIGIYKNYNESWIRAGSIEYIKDGESKFNENIGIRIFGGYTRNYAQKSLAIFAKDRYGAKSIDYKLFLDKQHIKKVKSFVLRNSGNDWGYTMMKDALVHNIVKDTMDIDYQSYHPSVVFINGKYWGIHNIREKINEDYIEANHGVDSKDIDLLQGKYYEQAGSNDEYIELMDYIESHSMRIESYYNEVKTKIDIDEYINYMITEIYAGNRDWPYNNIKYWREQSSAGKWRWVLYDTDFTFDMKEHDTFAQVLEANGPAEPNPPWSTFLFRSLMKNSDFENRFISTFTTHLNITFQPSRISDIITDMKEVISPEINRHFDKWPRRNNEDWETGGWGSIRELYSFSSDRDNIIRNLMSDHFDLIGNNNLQIISSNNGTVTLGEIPIENTYNGDYFDNSKVTLKAIPNEGYKFVKWNNNQTDKEITLTINNDITIEAIFEEQMTQELPKIVITEINYKSADDFNTGDWIELYNNDSISIDISGWILKDDKDSSSFIIASGTILEPNTFIVFTENASYFSALVTNVTAVGDFTFGLGKNDDSVRVFNADDTLIDIVSYDQSFPDAKGNGKTLSLLDPSSDNSLSENWIALDNHGSPGE